MQHRLHAAAAAAAALLVACTAHAAFDHLKCYKVKDPGTFKRAEADIDALRAAFGLDDHCLIKAKARMLCTPASKTVTSVEGGSDAPFPVLVLCVDQLCYK